MPVTPDELGRILAATEDAPLPRSRWPKCADPSCGEKLDPLWHDVGVHPLCRHPNDTAPAGGPPPSTVADLRGLLIEHEQTSARSTQKHIGPSEIGVTCQRALAYRMNNTPRRPDLRVPWAPIQGTAVHAYVADVLRWDNQKLGRERWLVEQRVFPDDEHPGSGDAYDVDTNTVVDWKFVGESSLTKYRRKVRPEYRVQAHLYGLGHARAGRPVAWVRLVFLARDWDYEKSFEWTEAYDPDVAHAALDRLYATADMLTALDVVNAPAMWGAVPATVTPNCKWCPYHRPGKPADASGCPGDVAAAKRRADAAASGLISTPTT